jgi:hypothetical protein
MKTLRAGNLGVCLSSFDFDLSFDFRGLFDNDSNLFGAD